MPCSAVFLLRKSTSRKPRRPSELNARTLLPLRSAPPELKPYDFTRSDISTRGRLPGLEVILDDFSRRLQSMFASQLGKSVDVNYDGMEIVTYGTLIQSLPLPASMHLIRLEPLRGMGILSSKRALRS